jgi:hypothetical protein
MGGYPDKSVGEKEYFREGYVPNPEHRGGPWGVAWTNIPQRASLPPGIARGGNLGKGGVDPQRGGTGKLRLPRGPQRRNRRNFNAGKHKELHRVKVTIPEHRAGQTSPDFFSHPPTRQALTHEQEYEQTEGRSET